MGLWWSACIWGLFLWCPLGHPVSFWGLPLPFVDLFGVTGLARAFWKFICWRFPRRLYVCLSLVVSSFQVGFACRA